ncbi:hypothetical protein BC939DRAFT_527285 [Gamsiella multidivaricata]|uniref:uncharacterized protein n=1 Tax=Gamsiella multidivaricata TaxID=101098 RepID=UPI00221FCEF4|nr:uncharacterized protein BC939DRAFT_527285 [Gamsiella multidivaricata]KAG0364618.1 hypothetical protein BGZ54_007331 [Gamsiella multidivaricata]KAI7827036.1 hypothetical protein BC939DRAFT_527285 [Gamsiella multidivaricata]
MVRLTIAMLSMIRSSLSKAAMGPAAARRSISASSKSNNLTTVVPLTRETNMTTSASASPSSSRRAFKSVAYTVLGSTALIAGLSHFLKDEVVYWTPNVRK